jgi:predicted GIY-YIG superfamily endonuclease
MHCVNLFRFESPFNNTLRMSVACGGGGQGSLFAGYPVGEFRMIEAISVMKPFDRNLGRQIQENLPESPGIYRFYDKDGLLIYVGKAKNLRRRLAQYRNAKRRKKHAKMRKIVAEAVRLETEVCADEFTALKLETQWIQTHRPRWNVAGAFFFLYPLVGVALENGILKLCYTTLPESAPEFRFHGAFRSRERTKEAFFALTDLLRLVGHAMPRPKRAVRAAATPRGSTYHYSFRQVPDSLAILLDAFFRGEDFAAIEELAVLLLERPTAVARREETQKKLRTIRLFWRHEIQVLKCACERTAWKLYPVPQRDRDQVFIAQRAALAGQPIAK